MYVEDRSKLNGLFLTQDPFGNKTDHSSNDDNQPPPPPQPPNLLTTSDNTNNYSNIPETSANNNNQQQSDFNTDNNNLLKTTHKYLVETQSEPFSKLSINLKKHLNDETLNSEPNTPVCLNRPSLQRQQSDLVTSRIIATKKNTPLIRIDREMLFTNAQQQIQKQQQLKRIEQSLTSTMQHSGLLSHIEPPNFFQRQQETQQSISKQHQPQQIQQQQITTNEPHQQYSELPLSAHPVTSMSTTLDYSTLDYFKRMPTTISHSLSFPVSTSALLKKSGQCKSLHCTQTSTQEKQIQDTIQSNLQSTRLQPHQLHSSTRTFQRQMTFPNSSTLFTEVFTTQQQQPSTQIPITRTLVSSTPLSSSSINSSINASSIDTQQTTTNTFLQHHHQNNHPSADHI